MPTYPSSVGGNSRYLQQQILRAGTARMGPVSIEPGDGHIRLNDGTNDTGFLDFNGVQLRYRGGLRGLTELTESFATSLESHTAQIGQNRGRIDGHDADVVRIDAKNTAQDQSLALKAWTSYVDQQDGAASTRMDGIDGTLANKAWTSYVDSQNSGQNTRMGNIESSLATKASITYVGTKASTSSVNAKNSTQDSAISAAQARADAAHSLAASKANVSYVDTKASQQELVSAVSKLSAAIRKVAQNTSTPDPFL